MIKNEYYVMKYMEKDDWNAIEFEIRSMGWDIYVELVNKKKNLIENYEELDPDFSSDMRFSLDDAMFILNCANEDIKSRIDDAIEGGVEIELQTKLEKQTFEYYNRPENADKKKQMTKMAIDMFNEEHRKKMLEKRHSSAIEFGLDEKKWKKLMNDDYYNVIFETKRYILYRPKKQQ